MRRYALRARLLQEFIYDGTGLGTFNPGPKEPMREWVAGAQNRAEKIHDTLIAPAIARHHETKSIASVDQALCEPGVLSRKVARKIFKTVVTEVAVKLAVDRELFVVQSLVGGVRAFEMIGRQRLT